MITPLRDECTLPPTPPPPPPEVKDTLFIPNTKNEKMVINKK